MSRRTNCKFFAQGTCFKGEHCEFLHNWKDPPNICMYYQKGMCTYGSRCRFVHVKGYRPDSSASSSSVLRRQRLSAGYVPRSHHSEITSTGKNHTEITSTGKNHSEITSSGKTAVRDASAQFASLSEVYSLPKCGLHDLGGGGNVESKRVKPADRPLCSLAADGICPHGENCPQIHGDLCPACGKQCLHPFSPQEREKHIKACEEKQQKLEVLKRSQEIECSVCLERVLSKTTAAERKFGILSECDHPFCVSCIRNWRNSTPSSGMDVNNTLRACPVCRKLSYFVVPSIVWYSTPEEKQETIENYKAKLRLIDCKHFKFGNGNCPFGTSCFYKHTIKPGSYMWKYNRPPPRRPAPRSRGRDILGVDVGDVFVHLLGEDMFDNDEDYDYDYDYDFYDEDDLSPIGMAFLLMQLNPESGSSSGEDDSLF